MSTAPLEPLNSQELPGPPVANELVRNQSVIVWSSFFLALLQSICEPSWLSMASESCSE
jgi:hypothetical protein